MNIVKDDNWYTVYNNEGVYVRCIQDKHWAKAASKKLNGSYITTKHYIGPSSTADGAPIEKKDDTVVYLFFLFIISIIILILFLIFK